MPSLRNLLAAAIATLSLIAIGCGGSEPNATSTPVPTPVVDVAALLSQSGAVMERLQSFHFRLYHDAGSLEITQGLFIDDVEGEIVKPDRISVTFRGNLGGFAIESSIISIGDTGYLTNPLTGRWETGPADLNSLGFFSPSEGIAAMKSQVRDAILLSGGEVPAGSYRIGGKLQATALSPLIGTAILEDAVLDLELVIDSEQHYLVEARFTGRAVASDLEDATRVIEISAFDEPISIDPPL